MSRKSAEERDWNVLWRAVRQSGRGLEGVEGSYGSENGGRRCGAPGGDRQRGATQLAQGTHGEKGGGEWRERVLSLYAARADVFWPGVHCFEPQTDRSAALTLTGDGQLRSVRWGKIEGWGGQENKWERLGSSNGNSGVAKFAKLLRKLYI